MTTIPGQAAVPPETAKPEPPWTSWIFLALAGGIVLFPLSYSWSCLENYSFGWWVPLLALFLLSERWSTRPAPEPVVWTPRVGSFLLGWAALFFFCRMALETSLSSRPLLWACAFLYVAALLYWTWVYGGKAWLRHFAFPICFLLISVPWPNQVEEPVVQGLARFNAWLVAQALVIGGVYAQAAGNVIVLANCTLGVEAACSGIRSLQAALMVAFLLGEFYRFSWPRRVKVLLLALGLALLGNFARALFLAVMASAYGVEAMNKWHDTAGGAILIFTSVTSWLVSAWLNWRDPQFDPAAARAAAAKAGSRRAGVARRLAFGILIAAVLAETATQGWFAWWERQAVLYPTWTMVLPSSPQYKDVPVPEESRDILKYDVGRSVAWADGSGWKWTAYWFRYHPKPTGETVFQAHNPDICLPAMGLRKVRDFEPFTAEVRGVHLQVQPKQFSWKGIPVYIFWMVYADHANFPMEKAVDTFSGTGAKAKLYFSNIWNARRASTSEMESLEIILAGPENYQDAKAAYLAQLKKIIVPDDPAVGQLSSHP